MDPIFEAYLNVFVEQERPKDELSIYITCKLSKTLWEQWKDLVTNLDEAEEIEKEPHCTFLWAKLEEDVDPEAVHALVKEEVEGLNFDLLPMGFKVFEDVSDGTQDCLVVTLDAPGDVTQLQTELADKLTANGMKLVREHPVWKPHMTIAYFPEGTEIKYSRPQNGMLDTPIKAKVDFMKINGGDEMELNVD
jgi:2'-5' RNA ligase